MDSFVLDILTEHALSGLRQDVIELEKYAIYRSAVVKFMGNTYYLFACPELAGRLATLGRLGMLSRARRRSLMKWVTGSFCVIPSFKAVCDAGKADVAAHNFAGIWTWADYANTLRNGLVAKNFVALCDKVAFFKIVMFAKHLRSQLSISISVLRRRQRALAMQFAEFILLEVVAEDAPQPAAEVVAEDAVMEIKVEFEGRGSKRRSRCLSYEGELTREREAKRRYGLRNTRAREERLAMLKNAEDAKRKVGGETESSPGSSHRRSRR